eukprot:TRINITY_DN33_c0_g1_i1.p1 TRINITY_DN33_c0_g1~~TRINITY_DN33_c0_g1_i1.p1  ORF type:complete len:424 (+),score=74.71 TRINITY_DN33_c0_g1_i1:90-1274(+)
MATLYLDLLEAGEQVLELARYVEELHAKSEEKKITNLVEECKKLFTDKKSSLIRRLLQEHEIVWQKGDDKEILGFFSVIATLLVRLGKDTVSQLEDELFTAASGAKLMVRLSVLSNLYNIYTDSEWRYKIFEIILQSMPSLEEFDSSVNDVLESIDERLKEWNAPVARKRRIYRLALTLAQQLVLKTESATEIYRRTCVKYLSTFEGLTNEEIANSKDDIKQVVVTAIKGFTQFDGIFNSAAVKFLETADKDSQTLQTLLQIFALEKYDAFVDFHKANGSFLESQGLVYDECLKKMRLLTLTTLASNHNSIHYDEISQALKLDPSEVEQWVIMGITENLLDAKIDQTAKTVNIYRVSQRIFSFNHWKSLKDRVSQWRKNVNYLLDTIHKSKEKQ